MDDQGQHITSASSVQSSPTALNTTPNVYSSQASQLASLRDQLTRLVLVLVTRNTSVWIAFQFYQQLNCSLVTFVVHLWPEPVSTSSGSLENIWTPGREKFLRTPSFLNPASAWQQWPSQCTRGTRCILANHSVGQCPQLGGQLVPVVPGQWGLFRDQEFCKKYPQKHNYWPKFSTETSKSKNLNWPKSLKQNLKWKFGYCSFVK